jgi:pantoate--beta-alanine ligase
MRTVTTIAAAREWRSGLAGRVGLVPTMGYLHEGHASLVRRARAECRHVVATVFLNPTQFGAGEDLAHYPRDLARDQALLGGAGCDVLFAPHVSEVYPPGFETTVDAGSVSLPLEGERRPGHFRGVATVVLKLLGMLQPQRAYFGRKDAQQLAVIRRMVRDLDVPVEVVGCLTVREVDGLAMSSRNAYLDAEERRAAPVLFRALMRAQALWDAGSRDPEALRLAMRETLAAEPRARVDYVSVADPLTFRELAAPAGSALACLAVFIGRARLIDNVALGEV